MSFIGYCFLLVLYLQASAARHMRIVDKQLYNQNSIFGKGLARDHLETRIHQKAISPSSTLVSLSKKKENPQGHETSLSPRVVAKDGAKIEERQAQRVLLENNLHDAEEAADNSNEKDGVGEDVIVMDYVQPHRNTPIHNKDP